MAIRMGGALEGIKVEIIDNETKKVVYIADSITKAGRWLGELRIPKKVLKNLYSGKPYNKDGKFYILKEKSNDTKLN